MRRLQMPLVLALVAAAFVVLIGLGVWQLARNEQKKELTRERDAAIAAAPLPADAASALDRGAFDFRRLSLDGEWDYERAQIIANRTRFGLRGEEVYVPLLPPGGGPAILVNRGWYPLGEREQVLARLEASEHPEGLILVPGGARASLTADGAWTRFHLDSIAAELPYSVVPFHVLAGELVEKPPRRLPGELPVTGYEGYRNTTPHVEYALTWFGLAAALVATAAVRIWQRSRGTETAPRLRTSDRSSDGHEAA